MKILVVVDSKTIRVVMDQCATTLGYEVVYVENKAESLAFVKSNGRNRFANA